MRAVNSLIKKSKAVGTYIPPDCHWIHLYKFGTFTSKKVMAIHHFKHNQVEYNGFSFGVIETLCWNKIHIQFDKIMNGFLIITI